MPLLTDEVRAMIGRQASYVAPEAMGLAAGRYFGLAVGDDNPLYTSASAAEAVGLSGPILPPTLLFESNQYTGRAADADGYAGHSWNIDIPGTNLVRGGNSYTWHRDVFPEDAVTATWTIADITERTTRAGQAMLVLSSRCEYTDADSRPIAEQVETLLYVAAGA